MHRVWFVITILGLSGCLPTVGTIDGDRFPCDTDDDCAGDGFVCVAHICRDPRDLRQPDAGPVDATPDRHTDAGWDSGVDAEVDAATDGSFDSETVWDVAAPDTTVADGWVEDSWTGDRLSFDALTQDGRRHDVGGGDTALLEDGALAEGGQGDGPEDAGLADGGDAAVDAGSDAGPCTADDDCAEAGDSPRICYSGRCGYLQLETVTTATSDIVAPSLGLDSQGRAVIAFYDDSSEDLGQSTRNGAKNWAYVSLDTQDDVGQEPQLSIYGDRVWVAYRKGENDTARLAADFQFAELSELGAETTQRVGFCVDYLGYQHILAKNDDEVLVYGYRQPQLGSIFDPPFVTRVSYGGIGGRWPALFRDNGPGIVYGTFVADSRPHVGFVDPLLGFVSTYVFPRTSAGCDKFGLGSSSSCNADRPVALALDRSGKIRMCSMIRNTSSSYRVVYMYDDGDRFSGQVVYTESRPESSGDDGARCAIVVDNLNVSHLFFAKTDGGGGRRFIHITVDHSGDNPVVGENVLIDGDSGYYPDVLVDTQGKLHMAYVQVEQRSGDYITEGTLIYGQLVWNPR